MRERYRRKLSRYLELSPDEPFLQLIWAANMLQAGHEGVALQYLREVPRDAIAEKIGDAQFLYKWELEILINELFTVPKRGKPIREMWRQLDCTRYDVLRNIVGTLRRLGNAESGMRLRRINVLEEMPRIAALQQSWQRGWFNLPQFYRSTFIYGQGASAAYFEKTYGITINDFSLIGIALHTHYTQHPFIRPDVNWGFLPITSEKFKCALRLLSLPIGDARDHARALYRRFKPVEYQPSILRQRPCITFGQENERVRAPLPQLILERITGGIFYDIIAAGHEVREEYGRRFEEYALSYLRVMLPGIDWRPEQIYRIRKAESKTPDILWCTETGVRLAIECKATRMSVEARYADSPLTVRGYDDLIKAVFQLWRFFSHCRRGLTSLSLRPDATGLVLTLDDWLTMANNLIREIFAAAMKMAAEKDPEITAEDMRPILFCAITDLETTLSTADELSFGAAVSHAVAENRQGWLLASSHDDVRSADVEPKPFPFKDDFARLLPWWEWLGDQRRKQQISKRNDGLQ